MAYCEREDSQHRNPRIHVLNPVMRTFSRREKKQRLPKQIIRKTIHLQTVKAMAEADRKRHAAILGVNADSLETLEVGRDTRDNIVFPERDSAGNIMTLVTRKKNGEKRCKTGYTHGLYYDAAALRASKGPVFIVEGGTDTLALTTLGLRVIGRHNNRATSGITSLIRRLELNNEQLVVVAENDRKENGLWPGLDGAKSSAQRLADEQQREIQVGQFELSVKDARKWLHQYLQTINPDALTSEQATRDALAKLKENPEVARKAFMADLGIESVQPGKSIETMICRRIRQNNQKAVSVDEMRKRVTEALDSIDGAGRYLMGSTTGSGKTYAAQRWFIKRVRARELRGETTKGVWLCQDNEAVEKTLRELSELAPAGVRIGKPPRLDEKCVLPDQLELGRQFNMQHEYCGKACPAAKDCPALKLVAQFNETLPDIVVTTQDYWRGVQGRHAWANAKIVISDEQAERFVCDSEMIRVDAIVKVLESLADFARTNETFLGATSAYTIDCVEEIVRVLQQPGDIVDALTEVGNWYRAETKTKIIQWKKFINFCNLRGNNPGAEVGLVYQLLNNKLKWARAECVERTEGHLTKDADLRFQVRELFIEHKTPIKDGQVLLLLDTSADSKLLAGRSATDITPKVTIAIDAGKAISVCPTTMISAGLKPERASEFVRGLLLTHPAIKPDDTVHIIGHRRHILHLREIAETDDALKGRIGKTAWFGGKGTRGSNWHEGQKGVVVVLGDDRQDGIGSLTQQAILRGIDPAKLNEPDWCKQTEYTVLTTVGSEMKITTSNYSDNELSALNHQEITKRTQQYLERGRPRLDEGLRVVHVGHMPLPGVPYSPVPLTPVSDLMVDTFEIVNAIREQPLKRCGILAQLQAQPKYIKAGIDVTIKRIRYALERLRAVGLITLNGKCYSASADTSDVDEVVETEVNDIVSLACAEGWIGVGTEGFMQFLKQCANDLLDPLSGLAYSIASNVALICPHTDFLPDLEREQAQYLERAIE